MSTLIIDIETIGETWDTFDTVTRDTLLRWVERTTLSESEYEKGKNTLIDSLGLSPFTGSIISIALYDLERNHGVVYYQNHEVQHEMEYEDFILKVRSEKEMLEDFWDGVHSYDTFVTCNGRRFDIPFILMRSAIHGVSPTIDLLCSRYLNQQKMLYHVDLFDQLTFYNTMRKNASLHMFCRSFGIGSPKTAEVHGGKITELFHARKFREIAEYNSRDVIVIAALYKKWLSQLAPQSFLNRFDTQHNKDF